MKKTVAGVCGVTDLMAKEGHQWAPFRGEGCNTFKVRLWDEVVKRRKDEFFGWAGAIVWGRGAISQFETWAGGGGREIIFRDFKISLDNT